jgi:hypothetical protein
MLPIHTSDRDPDFPSESIPGWALRYAARQYDPWSLTVDIIAVAVDGGRQDLQTLVILRGQDGPFQGIEAWPGGFVQWEADRTGYDAALRELYEETGVADPAFLEALRSYDTSGRDPRQFAAHPDPDTGAWVRTGTRVVSTAYLAMLPKIVSYPRPRPGSDAAAARWVSVYDYLPWEDLRSDASRNTLRAIERQLHAWAQRESRGREAAELQGRIERFFALDAWNEEEAAERWELILSAKLVAEAWRDRWGRPLPETPRPLFGRALAFDHRTMLADALARLRTRIKTTPEVVHALLEPPFKLSEMQTAYEAIGGRSLYQSNFRRVVAHSRAFVQPSGLREEPQGPGKPAGLYRLSEPGSAGRMNPPLNLPWQKPDLDRGGK